MLRRRSLRFLGALVAALCLLGGTVSGALAHAELERSSPAASTVVVERPDRLYLWFSEQPELRLAELRLLDSFGATVGPLAPRQVPGDPRALVADLPEITPGTYVATWRVTSAIDGHTTRGAVPFTYGAGQIPVQVSIAGFEGARLYEPSPLGVAGRAATFTGALILFGALLFDPLIGRRARHALSRRPNDVALVTGASDRAFGLVGAGALIAVLAGTIVMGIVQAAEASEIDALAVLGEPLQRALIGTRTGYLLMARLGIALPMIVLLPAVARDAGSRWIAILMAGSILVTITLGSHAAAAQQFSAVRAAIDGVHALAAGAWLGGLVQVCVTSAFIRRRPLDERRAVVPRLVGAFARMSWVVGLIALTGILQSIATVGSLDALERTPYGRTLLVKVGLVASAALLGILHWRVVGPRIRGLAQIGGRAAGVALSRAETRFGWTSGAEAVIGITVVIATGLLTAQQPAREAAIALRSTVVRASVDDVTFRLEIAPGEAGLNRTSLRVGGDLREVEKVVARVSHRDMDMGEQEIVFERKDEDLFAIDGGQFSMPGRWIVEPLVRRTGRADARIPIDVVIAEPLTVRGEDLPGFELTTPMIVGGQIALFGAIVLAGARRVAGGRRPALLGAVAVGLAAFLGGLSLVGTQYEAQRMAAARGPIPIAIDDPGLERARLIYQQTCASCHGLGGRGDGPLGRTLTPRPADLRIHVDQHRESQLFGFLRDGVPGTAMPAFRGQVEDDDMWRLVAFIKGFAEDGPRAAQTAVAGLREP
ncbi:MAG: c-type cytochrome [Chloroflexota bacterium]|nr:MAG: c-type cytochrome [Chloroflexota bacterium]